MADLREAIKADLTALAHLMPQDWAERRGGDPIARTINAARDIVDAHFDARGPSDAPAPRGFSGPGEDDPRRDFMATYFDRDDDITRGMVADFIDRIEDAARRADRERMAQEVERGEWDEVLHAARSGGLDAAWAEAEAALPLAGWLGDDGRWVLPSGSWIIGIEHHPDSGDGYFEPHYPAAYMARAEVRPGKWVTGDWADSPAGSLRGLAVALRGAS